MNGQTPIWHIVPVAKESKTGGGKGTNQYAIKGTPQSRLVLPNLPDGVSENVARLSTGDKLCLVDIDNLTAQPALLTALAADPDVDVVQSVACHPNTPAPVLNRLAKSKNRQILFGVAINPNTPASVLTRLARSRAVDARIGVAENPNADATLLTRLASDKSDQVRMTLAKNPSIPTNVAAQLARDPVDQVRQELTANMAVPVYLRQRAKLEGPAVR